MLGRILTVTAVFACSAPVFAADSCPEPTLPQRHWDCVVQQCQYVSSPAHNYGRTREEALAAAAAYAEQYQCHSPLMCSEVL